MRLIAWWHNLSLTFKIIGYVGIIAGAVVSGSQAAPILEPYWYAHRAYVRDYDASQLDPIRKSLTKIQLRQNADRRQSLIDEAAKRETELQGEQAKKLPQYRDLVQKRVDRINEELKTIDARTSYRYGLGLQ